MSGALQRQTSISAGRMFETRQFVPWSHCESFEQTRYSACVHDALHANPVAAVCNAFTLSQHTWFDPQVLAPQVISSCPCAHRSAHAKLVPCALVVRQQT